MGRKKYDGKAKFRRQTARQDDAAWRLSYLIAGAHLLSSSAPETSRYLMRTTQQIAKRVTLTLDSVTVKRQVCKKCSTLLKPTGPKPARVRVLPRPCTHVVVSCGHCGARRSFPANPMSSKKKSQSADENIENDASSLTEQDQYLANVDKTPGVSKCGLQ